MSEDTTSTMTPTVDDLLTEYDQWKHLLDRDSDDFDAIAKLVALYRFAISHYNETGTELLLRAIKAIESAEKDR